MAKKKVDDAAKAAAAQAEERRKQIIQYNASNDEGLFIIPDKIPTEEDVNSIKEEWETAVKALQAKNDYLIADEENSLRVARFLENWADTQYWFGRAWVGVINIKKLLHDFIAELTDEQGNQIAKKPLLMEYYPLQFCQVMLDNYIGKGYDEAVKMSEIWDEYVPILDTLKQHVDWYNEEASRCNRLQKAWNMRASGFYATVVVEDDSPATDAPKNKEEFDAAVASLAAQENTDAVQAETATEQSGEAAEQ